MAEDSTVEYKYEMYESLDDNEVPNIEQVYVVSTNDDDDSDEQFDEDEVYLVEEQTESGTDSLAKICCDICDREFITIAERNQHIEEHFKPIECPICSRTFIGDRAFQFHTSTGKCKEAKAKTNLELFRCSLCNEKVFDSMVTLNNHMRSEHDCSINGDRLSCERCNRTFGKMKYLRKHIRELHDMATPFDCETCGKTFNRKANLMEHELIHQGKYLAECKTCGKSYRTTSALRLHERTHTGEKPYKCDLCNDKAYAYNTDLKRHKRSHGIIDKEFHCPKCKQIFYEPKFLRKHLQKEKCNSQPKSAQPK